MQRPMEGIEHRNTTVNFLATKLPVSQGMCKDLPIHSKRIAVVTYKDA